MRNRADPITGVRARTGARGFGLPPPSKFRSGHLPASAISVSRTISGDVDNSASASENDMSTDSEEDVYGTRYSLDSSPQRNTVPNRSGYRYGNPLGRSNNGSDYFFSDVSSSRETLVGGHRKMEERMTSKNGRYPVRQNGYTHTEDDSSDSAASSEFSTTHVGGSINGAIPMNRASMASEGGYSSSQPSRMNVGNAPKKVYISLKLLSL